MSYMGLTLTGENGSPKVSNKYTYFDRIYKDLNLMGFLLFFFAQSRIGLMFHFREFGLF